MSKKSFRDRAVCLLPALVLVGWVVLLARQSISSSVEDGFWMRDPDVAFARAAVENKPVVMDFYADWCAPCRQMDRTTFSDPAVRERLSKLIPLKVDVDQRPDLADRYGVTALPTTVIASPSGRAVASRVGYLDVSRYLGLLRAFPEVTTGTDELRVP